MGKKVVDNNTGVNNADSYYPTYDIRRTASTFFF